MTEHRSDAGAATTSQAFFPLDPTGVPGLDEVLGGGIQRGSLAILAGPPGSGKTILAHHIAFSAARARRHTTILTAFSEPTNKLVAHLRPFAFFDQELLGELLDMLSIQQFLRQGLQLAVEEIVSTVRATKANLVVLDGFRGVRETAEHPEEARRFIYDVSNRLSLLGVTLLLTSEANARDSTFFPEATTADVLLGLSFDAIDARTRRVLEVLKVRGAEPLAGSHALTISDDGVTIYPRLEARVARLTGVNRTPTAERTGPAPREALRDQESRPPAGDLADTGIPGLDSLLGGGLVPATSTLLVGERGTGKTLFGLRFAIAGARAGEPGLFVSFRETVPQLIRKVAPFEWSAAFQQALDSGSLTILRTPPIELQADVLAGHLLTLLDETQARRLVVDEIGELAGALSALGYRHRFHDFLAALVEALRLRNITSVFTSQLAEEERSTLERWVSAPGALSQNLLWLRQTPDARDLRRSLVILQTSLSPRSGGWHRVSIQPPRGIVVLESASEPASRQSLDRGNSSEHTKRGAGYGSRLHADSGGDPQVTMNEEGEE